MADGDGGQGGGGDGGGSGDGGAGTGTNGSGSDNADNGQGGDKKDDGKTPDPVPYARFKEQQDLLNTLKKEKEEREKADAAKARKKQEEDGNFQEIIKDLTPKAERAAALEKTLSTYLETELKDIPEDRRSLIPDGLSVEQKLEYIAKNRAILRGDGKKNVNRSSSPGNGAGGDDEPTEFTLEQLQDPAFYDKHRDAILKAQKEGRIK